MFEIADHHKLSQTKYPLLPKKELQNDHTEFKRKNILWIPINHDLFQMSKIDKITRCKSWITRNIKQQSRNTLPWCSCVLQSCDSLLVPLQLSDGSPQEKQLLVRDCWPPQAVAEQVPHAPQDDHTICIWDISICVRNSTWMIHIIFSTLNLIFKSYHKYA